jgi:hypothetical protein
MIMCQGKPFGICYATITFLVEHNAQARKKLKVNVREQIAIDEPVPDVSIYIFGMSIRHLTKGCKSIPEPSIWLLSKSHKLCVLTATCRLMNQKPSPIQLTQPLFSRIFTTILQGFSRVLFSSRVFHSGSYKYLGAATDSRRHVPKHMLPTNI